MSIDPLAGTWFIIDEGIAFDRATTPRIQLLDGMVLCQEDDSSEGAYSIAGDDVTIMFGVLDGVRYELRALQDEGGPPTSETKILAGDAIALFEGEDMADPVSLVRDGPWLVEWERQGDAKSAAA